MKKLLYGVVLMFLMSILILSGCSSTQTNTSTTNNEEVGKVIKAPDTGTVLFKLNGTEIIEGDCHTAKPFDEYGVTFPKDCESIVSTNIANYCELGNKPGENANYYYCRPMRMIKCKLTSSSGEVKDIKYYSITKVLKCNNTTEQLFDIVVKSCTKGYIEYDCS